MISSKTPYILPQIKKKFTQTFITLQTVCWIGL